MQEQKYYPLTGSQQGVFQMRLASVHRQVLQIPTHVTLERRLDHALLLQALNLENERNDSLRLRLKKVKGRVMQYFTAPQPFQTLPFADFTGQSNEAFERYLNRQARRPLNYMRGETWRAEHFRTPAGQDGIAFCVFHVNMDLAAVLLFYRDLLAVYGALETGAQMPAMLASFEQNLPRELEREANEQSSRRHEAFFKAYFQANGPSIYAGADHMRQLQTARKRKKNPQLRSVSALNMIHDRAELVHLSIDAQTVARIDGFARSKNVPFQAVIYLGMRLWLSKINEQTPDVTLDVIVNRRATLDHQNMGGCRMQPVPVRTVLPAEQSFDDAIMTCAQVLMQVMRHSDYPSVRVVKMMDQLEHRPMGHTTFGMLLSCFPPGSLDAQPQWGCRFSGENPGYFAMPLYAILMPDAGGAMDCYYWHLPHRVTRQEVMQLHENMLRAVLAGIEDSNCSQESLMQRLEP